MFFIRGKKVCPFFGKKSSLAQLVESLIPISEVRGTSLTLSTLQISLILYCYLGDKAPKSRVGRIFSIIWIVIGIIAFGMITGDITGKILEANDPPPKKMDGKKVGTLRFRDYDSYVVSTHGGYSQYNTDATNFSSDVLGLVNKLRREEIDGFLLDRYTLWAVLDSKTTKTNLSITKEDAEFFHNDTLRTEQVVDGDSLSYGILIKKLEDFRYFKDFIRDAQLRNTVAWTRLWLKDKDRYKGHYHSEIGENALFSFRGDQFQLIMLVLVSMIGAIIIFGVCFEVYRRKDVAPGTLGPI